MVSLDGLGPYGHSRISLSHMFTHVCMDFPSYPYHIPVVFAFLIVFLLQHVYNGHPAAMTIHSSRLQISNWAVYMVLNDFISRKSNSTVSITKSSLYQYNIVVFDGHAPCDFFPFF